MGTSRKTSMVCHFVVIHIPEILPLMICVIHMMCRLARYTTRKTISVHMTFRVRCCREMEVCCKTMEACCKREEKWRRMEIGNCMLWELPILAGILRVRLARTGGQKSAIITEESNVGVANA